jgi:hypothetical protein
MPALKSPASNPPTPNRASIRSTNRPPTNRRGNVPDHRSDPGRRFEANLQRAKSLRPAKASLAKVSPAKAAPANETRANAPPAERSPAKPLPENPPPVNARADGPIVAAALEILDE